MCCGCWRRDADVLFRDEGSFDIMRLMEGNGSFGLGVCIDTRTKQPSSRPIASIPSIVSNLLIDNSYCILTMETF